MRVDRTRSTNLAFGDHELAVRAKDNAGNVDPTPAEYSWEIGGIPPAVLIESGPDIESTRRDATFVFSADTTERIFLCSLDCGEPSPCQSPHTYNGLPLGPHTFEVQVVVDPEFAIAEAPISTYEWTVVAVTPPETILVFGPAARHRRHGSRGRPGHGRVRLLERQDAGALRVRDGRASPGRSASRPPSTPASRSATTCSASAPTTCRCRRTTTRRRSRSRSALVPPPETTIVSGPEGEVNGTTANFTFSSTVAGSTFECALDLGPFVACPNPYTLTNLTDGEHMLEVRARTADGVVDLVARRSGSGRSTARCPTRRS